MSESTQTEPEIPLDELFCWRDASRICDPTCVAYDRNGVGTLCRVINNQSLIALRLQRIAEKKLCASQK